MQEVQLAKPKVYVLMSTYNGERYLQTQIDSIFAQEGVEVCLMARDDGSTDRTISILEANATDKPITIQKGNNCGSARSFMRLVHDVPLDADYYAFCDQDDKWLPQKLICAIKRLEMKKINQPMVYYSNVRRVGANLEDIKDPFDKNYHTESFEATMVETAAPGCTMVVNRTMVELLRLYDPKYLSMHDSWTIRVCAAVGGTVCYDADSYILYRQHEDNVIGGVEKMSYGSIGLFLYRAKKFFDFSEKTGEIAKELWEGYQKQIPDKNKKIIGQILKCRTSGWSRCCVAFGRKIKTGYALQDMKFTVKVLLNQMWK